MRIKLILITSVLVLFSIDVRAQKSILSPYSRYGVGELVEQSYGSNYGYGSISAGLREGDVINYSNPASYTAQDTNSFIFDIGLSARSSLQKSQGVTTNRKSVGFDHLAIGFPVTTWWKSSIGVVPLSQVGYSVQETKNPATPSEMVTHYQGEGGVRQFYIGNAFGLTDQLSLGVNFFHLFGNATYTAESYLPQDSMSGQFQRRQKKYFKGNRFQLGLQYQTELFSDYTLTAGLSYDMKARLNMDADQKFFTYYRYTTGEGVPQQDTIDRVSSSTSTSSHYPSGYKVGFTLKNPRLLMGADFKYQNWSALDDFDNLQDSYSMHAGIQYTPDPQALRNYLKRIDYRFGAFYKQSYLKLNNHQLKDYGITFGLGIPLKYNKTKFNLSLQLGRRGTTAESLVEENYAMVNFNITFYDFWFIQKKYK